MSENNSELVSGMFAKEPKAGAPDFIKYDVSIIRKDLIEFLQSKDGEWVNLQLKEARSGKLYFAVNDWKPKGSDEGAPMATPKDGGGDDPLFP